MQTIENVKKSVELLKTFHDLQNERTQVYKLFETAYKEFMANPNQKTSILNYQRVCQGVTLSFKEISESVREVEQDFTKIESENATALRNIQNLEREKLQNTVAIQKLEQQMAQETLRIRKELESEEFLKNHVHDEHCGHKHEEVEEVIRGEKLAILEEELKKYKHAQANVIEQINEQLEELRYTMADLREELQERKDEEPAIAPKKEEPAPEVGIYL